MQRKNHSPEFKARIVLEALKEIKMINQIASENNINPNLVSRWKNEAVASLHTLFTKDSCETLKIQQEYEFKINELYNQIGKLSMELEWLKKKSGK